MSGITPVHFRLPNAMVASLILVAFISGVVLSRAKSTVPPTSEAASGSADGPTCAADWPGDLTFLWARADNNDQTTVAKQDQYPTPTATRGSPDNPAQAASYVAAKSTTARTARTAGKSNNKATTSQSRNDSWQNKLPLRLAAVRRLAVRVDRSLSNDDKLDRSLRESFTELLQKSGVVLVVDEENSGGYDAVLTLHYEVVDASCHEASAIFARLDDTSNKYLWDDLAGCSSFPKGEFGDVLHEASEKLVNTLVVKLEDARRSSFAEEKTATPPVPNGGSS